MFLKGRVEQDDNKRKAIVNDIQKYLAKAMYAIPAAGSRRQPHGRLARAGELARLPDGPPEPQALDRHDEGAVQDVLSGPTQL